MEGVKGNPPARKRERERAYHAWPCRLKASGLEPSLTDAMAGGRRAGAVRWAARGVDGSRESPEVSQAMGDGCGSPTPTSLPLALSARKGGGGRCNPAFGRAAAKRPNPTTPPQETTNAGS